MKYNEKNPPLVCMMTQSTCYKNTKTMEIKGILIHSTGANNPYLRRYVQPDDNAPNKKELINLLGVNTERSDWNHSEQKAGLNAWIGLLSNGEVTTVQTMPWDYRPWGCGSGINGSCNSGWIQFECAEDNLSNKNYFEKIYNEMCELIAFLCKKFNIDPQGSSKCNGIICPNILCHADSHKLGLGSNHADILHWFKKYNKTIQNVRDDVSFLIQKEQGSKASANNTPTEQVIWTALLKELNNSFAVAGIMGNLFAESGLNPKNLQNTFEKKLGMTDLTYTQGVDNNSYKNFVKDKAGYGLAQWTYYARKEALLQFARKNKTSIGDLEMQLAFLIQELKAHASLWSELKEASNIAKASDLILTQFEKPADQSTSVKKLRQKYAQEYYNKYSRLNAQGGKIPYKVYSRTFLILQNAINFKEQLAQKGINALLAKNGYFYHLQLGSFLLKNNALAFQKKLKSQHIYSIIKQ